MNAIKTIVATLAIAAATVPAFAFANDGVPPDVQAKWNENPVGVEDSTIKAAPQYLHGLGEESLVPNPVFAAAPVTRFAKGEIRRGAIPASRYVGA